MRLNINIIDHIALGALYCCLCLYCISLSMTTCLPQCRAGVTWSSWQPPFLFLCLLFCPYSHLHLHWPKSFSFTFLHYFKVSLTLKTLSPLSHLTGNLLPLCFIICKFNQKCWRCLEIKAHLLVSTEVHLRDCYRYWKYVCTSRIQIYVIQLWCIWFGKLMGAVRLFELIK